MENVLTFKQYYNREIKAIQFTYGETFKEAKFNIDNAINIQKQYCEYLSQYDKIPLKKVKTIPDKAQQKLFLKYNMDKIN